MKKQGPAAYRLRNFGMILILVELLFWGAYAIFHFAVVERVDGFRYSYPEALWGLYFLPLITLGFFGAWTWKKRALERFGEWALVRTNLKAHHPRKGLLQNGLFRMGIGLCLMALAGPQIGTKKEEAESKGIELMVCLDLSSSMNAEDIRPSRLQKAKRALEKLLDRLHGDRIGMVVFAGDAYVQIPITSDLSSARIFLSDLSTDIVPVQGTSLGSAIDLARNSFDQKSQAQQSIIVISDGENHRDDPIAAAKSAEEEGIVVHTVGMGTPDGGPIPIYKKGRQVGYKKDRQGQTVISKLNEEVLKKSAEAGNGSFIQANNTRVGLNMLMDELQQMQKETFKTTVYADHADRFQIFLIPGTALLLLAVLLGSLPWGLLEGKNAERS